MRYEEERSNSTNYLYHQTDINLTFPVHIHNSFEFIIVKEGSLTVQIDGESHVMNENQCTLIFPNQAHSYSTEAYSKSYLCIFSVDHAEDYAGCVASLEMVNPIIPYNFEAIFDTDAFMIEEDKFKRKSILYYVIHLFNQTVQYRKREIKNYEFIKAALAFIEANYMSTITLKQLAEKLGYDYNYTSSLINHCFHRSFNQLVNEYRINSAMHLLSTTNMKVIDIAMICGFNSLRAFNRNFGEISGTSPTQFREEIELSNRHLLVYAT